MIRIVLTEIQPGDVLAQSVANPDNPAVALLRQGTALNPRLINALKRYGIRSLWIKQDNVPTISTIIGEERFAALRATLGELKKTVVKMAAAQTYMGDLAKFRRHVIQIFQNIVNHMPVYCLLDDIYHPDTAMLFHAGNVCVLSLLLGQELKEHVLDRQNGGRDLCEEMAPLGLGALLHDIGKLHVPENVRNNPPWELSMAERERMRTHTTIGFRILRPQVGAIAANMALCHHRNFDGSGYPEELAESGSHMPMGEQIHIFSRVVTVANAYDELVGAGYCLPIEALEELNCARRHHFAPEVLAALNRVVPPFGLGDTIRLSTGHYGVVTGFDPDRPFRPPVQLLRNPDGSPLPSDKQMEIRLGEYPQYHIHYLQGRHIAHLLPRDPNACWEGIT